METITCDKCRNEIEVPEEEQFGGDFVCPFCGCKYDVSFDTNYGMSIECLGLPK
jgi:uncharacterized protein YbaR (Trm112 family)